MNPLEKFIEELNRILRLFRRDNIDVDNSSLPVTMFILGGPEVVSLQATLISLIRTLTSLPEEQDALRRERHSVQDWFHETLERFIGKRLQNARSYERVDSQANWCDV